jgi:hypothetical protein
MCTRWVPVEPGVYFVDCPMYTRDEAIEYPVVDEDEYYMAENSEITTGAEDPRFAALCKTPVLAPFFGYPPNFKHAWLDSDPLNNKMGVMIVWCSGVITPETADRVMVVNVAVRGTSPSPELLDANAEGAITIQIPPECEGRIIGFKAAPYLDKVGASISDPTDDESEPSDINGAYIRLGGGPATPGEGDHSIATNPFAKKDQIPLDDAYPGESSGTNAGDSTTDWLDGEDKLQWLGEKIVKFGFKSLEGGRGIRFYVKGYDYATLMELAIGELGGGTDSRLKQMYIGSTRVYYFGTPGDKVRWYLDRRCGEPVVYVPEYWEGGVAPDTWSDQTPRGEPSPRECLSSVASGTSDDGDGDGGGGTPPTISITSGP